jgi:hypothetical protein
MTRESGNIRSQRRSGRAQKRERIQIAAPAYIKRKIPYYEFLGEEGLGRHCESGRKPAPTLGKPG